MVKKSASDATDVGMIPESGRPLEKGMATHSSSSLENWMGKGSLASCSPWGCKDSDMIQQPNNK